MKLLVVIFALIGLAAAAQLPDSATQGPNPQDIATPEPEYIDIDLPEPAPAAPAPAPVRFAPPPPRPVARPAPRPVFVPAAPAPVHRFQPPAQQLVPGHSYSKQNGYQYRRPVYVRRFYRRRY